jgi:hypothetical protein
MSELVRGYVPWLPVGAAQTRRRGGVVEALA